ncbi:MAG TPA: DUF882 domain-containing protein [Burkholderiales bacterium]|nr:DUF882 domain-containing protein [Burkholderiales bacterium]
MKNAAVLGAGVCLPAMSRAALTRSDKKSISFYHTHTGESLHRVFWSDGQYLPDALIDINRVLRDHRTNQVAAIEPALLSLLERLCSLVGSGDTFHVISGYRSPETNQMLAAHSDGVAKHSLHMDGKAIDIRIPGRDLTQLRNAALNLRSGGVGFYPGSQFVHVDIGRVRSW